MTPVGQRGGGPAGPALAGQVPATQASTIDAAPPPPRHAAPPSCLRCGFPIVSARPMGCKNPCRNCGTVYPLGDCSD